ncbi:alpha-xenorhabdolysin family binary toxin subunit A [Pseudomonas sp. UBA6562]|uniref:alpha-xenorhabdolysin family binary toxin subunit A n=1 Tax=Pseudomonas sp. UBA6562 TaxID=1947332 RepID=UPI0025D6DD4F|nr:alpha-xenorhabdolysin family binary toxin subunit A [Pseudomonas sp. UBA6562]
MSAESKLKDPDFAEVAKRASEEPNELFDAMIDSGGENEGGVTLTKQHILSIKKYHEYSKGLPSTKEDVEVWLGYTTISQPELQPVSLAKFFSEVRDHGAQWQPIVTDNKTLTFQLKIAAGDIIDGGTSLIKKCDALILANKDEDPWRELPAPEVGTTLTPLTDDQRKGVKSIARYIDIMQKAADDYLVKVDDVVKKTETFANAFTELIKKAEAKQAAVGNYQKEQKTEDIKTKIADLDKKIAVLQKQYEEQVQDALKGIAGGVIGFIISGIFFGVQAEQTRKTRNEHQTERRQLSLELAKFHKIDGAVEELNTNLLELVFHLRDADVSAGLLHTAWLGIKSFLEDSKGKLDDIESVEDIGLFRTYFQGFVRQWVRIEKKSEQLNDIFEQAYNSPEVYYV